MFVTDIQSKERGSEIENGIFLNLHRSKRSGLFFYMFYLYVSPDYVLET